MYTVYPADRPHDTDCSPADLALVIQHDVSFMCHQWRLADVAVETTYRVCFHRAGQYKLNVNDYMAEIVDERGIARGEVAFFEAPFVPNVTYQHIYGECRGATTTRTHKLTVLICNSVRPYIVISNNALWLAIDTIRATQKWVAAELDRSLRGIPTDVLALVASYYTVTQPCSFYS